MSSFSIIVARSMQDAINSAVIDWRWEQTGNPDFRLEFRRPDNGERVRWAGERGALRGLPWNTTLYQGYGWRERRDWREIEEMLKVGYLRLGEPDLAAPVQRPRQAYRAELMRQMSEFFNGKDRY